METTLGVQVQSLQRARLAPSLADATLSSGTPSESKNVRGHPILGASAKSLDAETSPKGNFSENRRNKENHDPEPFQSRNQ
jgi:hypothetical protein